ncbi:MULTISPECIES: hypothetical protein [Chryseobacterium]|jgi:hypothetical protein|uniref:Prevent-host-death protein n=1 Tax=Chryseobacterium geocarposphaerae TaxID=1416776 RepID=A0ABU1L8V8_9FLAO|nr:MULTISPECIES: hypothetical protein [Chryseobacterium]ALR30106.1 prevent-host-death protein [Chryseobacterium sp. IHB B 17019]MDR6403147.1 hypothetical protein [Chryseobacterium geocarposphaerae]MDR6696702.1 hypothetical protein [Chryseobacterium ginsenosidimutans]
MNYTLELNTQEPDSNIVFNTIKFDSFKVNIIERYTGGRAAKLCEALFKLRTLDDEIIKTRNGNSRIKIKDDNFETYYRLTRVLNSYDYKNRLINRKDAEQDYVHFMLSLVITNYELS